MNFLNNKIKKCKLVENAQKKMISDYRVNYAKNEWNSGNE